MKKFLMYCLVLVVILFLGFTTYYFVANKEKIVLAHDQTQSLKLNVGEAFAYSDLVSHTQPHKTTKIKIEVENQEVLSYDKKSKEFTALSAGKTVLTITPSNARFGPFVLNVVVGNGLSTELPYFISDATELKQIGANGSIWTNNMHYELVSDIYLTEEFTPIAHNSAFTGSFNGGGHTIYDLKISETSYITTAGLFSEIAKNAVVKNLKLSGATISGQFVYAGVVAGINKGTICLTEVLNSTITNSRTGAYIGAIAGSNEASATSSSVKGANIGMCGVQNVSINTTGGAYVGGIVGKNIGSVVEDSFVSLNTFASNNSSTKFGGIAGQNLVSSGNTSIGSSILRTHASVSTLNNAGLTSGVAGEVNDASTTFKNSYTRNYFNIDTNNYVANGKNFTANQIEKKDASELAIQSTYIDWDFDNVWKMNEVFAVVDFENAYSSTINQGDIDQDGDNIIDNPDDPNNEVATLTSEIFQMVSDMRANPNAGKNYVVSGTHTINMSIMPWNEVAFEPIGTADKPFTGTFIVRGSLTFTNLRITDKQYAGFFGYVGSGATISNVDFINVDISNDPTDIGSNTAYAGVVAGYVGTGAKVVGCDVSGVKISSYDNIGGIAGINYGTIHSCKVTSGSASTLKGIDASCNVGGIVGKNAGSVVASESTNATLTLNTTASGYIGGVVGVNDGAVSSSTAKDCEIGSESQGILRLGGVVGQNNKNISSATVESVEILASVTSKSAFAGGVCAVNGTNGKISGAVVADSVISSYCAGGIAVDNFGKAERVSVGSESLGEGKISGHFVGGLVVYNQKSAVVSDSGVYATLEGVDDWANTNGFAYSLKEASVIEHCFGAGVITGKGGFNADTDTAYRNIWSGMWQNLPWNDKMGAIKNSIIYNVSGKYVQGFGVIIDVVENPIANKFEHVVSGEVARGSDNFKTFTKAGFTTSAWEFVSGKLPVPKN